MATKRIGLWNTVDFTMALWARHVDEETVINYRIVGGDELLIEHPTSKGIVSFNLTALRKWYADQWSNLSGRLVGIILITSSKDAVLQVKATEYGFLGDIEGERTNIKQVETF